MDTRVLRTSNNESGTISGVLSDSETTSKQVSPVPAEAPGILVMRPGTAYEEHILFKSKDDGSGTINELVRDITGLNGGSGREHPDGASWETMQGAEYVNNIVDSVIEGFWQEQRTTAKVDADEFTVKTNRTTYYTEGRIIRFNQSASYLGFVLSSSYSAGTGLTTVTVVGVELPTTLTHVELAIMPASGVNKQMFAEFPKLAAAPGNAPTSMVRGYVDSNGQLNFKDESGNVVSVAPKRIGIQLTPQAAMQLATAKPALTNNTGTNKNDKTLDFDAGTDEYDEWEIYLPIGYVPVSATLYLVYRMASATSGDIMMVCEHGAIGDGEAWDAALTTDAFTAETVPDTAGKVGLASKALTVTGWAAGDTIRIKIRRNADDAGDTATGDLKLMYGFLLVNAN